MLSEPWPILHFTQFIEINMFPNFYFHFDPSSVICIIYIYIYMYKYTATPKKMPKTRPFAGPPASAMDTLWDAPPTVEEVPEELPR